MKPVLLVIDIQNAFLDANKGLRKSVEKRVRVINDAIRFFRRRKLPIVVVYHTEEKEGPKPGTRQFEFSPAIDIKRTDAKVIKNYPNAFNKTPLEKIVRRRGCDTVVIAGLSASGCVLATYVGAIDRDLEPYLVQDGVAAGKEEYVRFAEDICKTLTIRKLSRILT